MTVWGWALTAAVVGVVAVWAAASLAIGGVGGPFRKRWRLPPTRHARRTQLDLWG